MRILIKLIILAGLAFGFMLVFGIFNFSHGFMKNIDDLNGAELLACDNIKYVKLFGDNYFLSVVYDGQLYAKVVSSTVEEMDLLVETYKALGRSTTNVSYIWAIAFVIAALITLFFPKRKKRRA